MKSPLRIKFLGKNGYDGEAEKACEHLTIGKRYRVEGASVGQSHSAVRINGRGYNSVLFSVSVATLCRHFPNCYTRIHERIP